MFSKILYSPFLLILRRNAHLHPLVWDTHKIVGQVIKLGLAACPYTLRTGVKLCSPTTIIDILHYLQAQESSAVRHQRVENSIRSGVRQAFKSGGAESVMEFETALRGTVAGGVLGWTDDRHTVSRRRSGCHGCWRGREGAKSKPELPSGCRVQSGFLRGLAASNSSGLGRPLLGAQSCTRGGRFGTEAKWKQAGFFSSVAQLCLTLYDPVDCSILGFPVHHQCLEPTQTHVHRGSDAIQPSHPLSSPSPPALNLSQHQGLFKWKDALCSRWPKYWSLIISISPSNKYSGLISFRMDWFDLLAVQGTLKSLLQHHSSKASILWRSAFFIVQLSHPYMTTGKTIASTRRIFVGKVVSLLLNVLSG